MSFLLGLVNGVATAAVEDIKTQRKYEAEAQERFRELYQTHTANRDRLAFSVSDATVRNSGWISSMDYYSQPMETKPYNALNYGDKNPDQTYLRLINLETPDGVPLVNHLVALAETGNTDAKRDLQRYGEAIAGAVQGIQREYGTQRNPETGAITPLDISNRLYLDKLDDPDISPVLRQIVATSGERATGLSRPENVFGSTYYQTNVPTGSEYSIPQEVVDIVNPIADWTTNVPPTAIDQMLGRNSRIIQPKQRAAQINGVLGATSNPEAYAKAMSQTVDMHKNNSIQIETTGGITVVDSAKFSEIWSPLYLPSRGDKYVSGNFTSSASLVGLSIRDDRIFKVPGASAQDTIRAYRDRNSIKIDQINARRDIAVAMQSTTSAAIDLLEGGLATKGIVGKANSLMVGLRETANKIVENAASIEGEQGKLLVNVSQAFLNKFGGTFDATDPLATNEDGSYKDERAAQAALNALLEYYSNTITFQVARIRQTSSDRTTDADLKQAALSTNLQSLILSNTAKSIEILRTLNMEAGIQLEYARIMAGENIRLMEGAQMLMGNVSMRYLSPRKPDEQITGTPQTQDDDNKKIDSAGGSTEADWQ